MTTHSLASGRRIPAIDRPSPSPPEIPGHVVALAVVSAGRDRSPQWRCQPAGGPMVTTPATVYDGVCEAPSAARTSRPTRQDALPEHQEYRDDGCDLFASCLSCPLPRCRYDVPGGVRTMLNRERDHQIRVLRDDCGLSVDDLAEAFDISRRTVFRALADGRRR